MRQNKDGKNKRIIVGLKNRLKNGIGQLWRKKKLWIIGAAVLVAVLCAVLVPIRVDHTVNERYDAAVQLTEDGRYDKALDIFTSLNGFSDSMQQAAHCQNMLDYINAKDLIDEGNYYEAFTAFTALGEFENAQEKANECETMLAYIAANALLDEGQFEEAASAFDALGGYEDATDLATESETAAEYARGISLMESGDYQEAKSVFKSLGDYEDAKDKAVFCTNMLAYLSAEDEYANGQYYTAYIIFGSLGDFEDAAQRQQQCIQPFPTTGEWYRDDRYAGGDCYVTIIPPAYDGSENEIKIYSESNELICRAAIAQGAQLNLALPSGTYRIEIAYGFGSWFGEKESFGDNGVYETLYNNETGSDLFAFETGNAYVLALRSEEGVIVGIPISRNDF